MPHELFGSQLLLWSSLPGSVAMLCCVALQCCTAECCTVLHCVALCCTVLHSYALCSSTTLHLVPVAMLHRGPSTCCNVALWSLHVLHSVAPWSLHVLHSVWSFHVLHSVAMLHCGPSSVLLCTLKLHKKCLLLARWYQHLHSPRRSPCLPISNQTLPNKALLHSCL